MRKKIINGLLIFGVSIIWMFVLKKMMNIVGEKGENLASPPIAISSKDILEFEKDTFNLAVFKRDPFFAKFKTEKVKVNRKKNGEPKKNSKKIPVKKKMEPRPKWPKLKYFGYMKGSDNKEELALIKINNKLQRVRAKENINEIHVQSVFADSVIIRIGKNIKTVYK